MGCDSSLPYAYRYMRLAVEKDARDEAVLNELHFFYYMLLTLLHHFGDGSEDDGPSGKESSPM